MMGKTSNRSIGWGGAVRAASVVVLLLAACPHPAAGGVVGSKHDFTASGPGGQRAIDTGGPCTPCHRVHYAPDGLGLWKRDLSDERNFFDQDGDPNPPNYLATRGAAILCYDCHDDMVSGANPDPPAGVWAPGREPEDIALGGTLIGYYEEGDGTKPGPVPPPSPPTNGDPTGGHYWKSEPSDAGDLRKQGDKIACSLCHDPHNAATSANMVFFRTTSGDGTAVGLGDGHLASTNTRSGADMGPSAGNGRSMCEACHGNSDQGAQQTFFTVQVPPPPPGVDEHIYTSDTSSAVTPCTDCHPHNRPAGCNECHGYPPLVATPFDRVGNRDGQSYGGGAGAHRRHLDALGAAIFRCEICHGPNPGRITTPWHAWDVANNRGTTIVSPENVDIIGQTAYWGPGPAAGYVGGASTVGPQTGYSFQRKGGSTQRCYGLTCHGEPPQNTGSVFLDWTDDMVDDTPGPTYGNFVGDGAAICKWCHDATPAQIGTGPIAPNVLGDNNGLTGVWNTGTWGADVNGHGLASGNYEENLVGESPRNGVPAAAKECTVCHDAGYAGGTPAKTHFGGASLRLRDTINEESTIADNPDNTCLACHQISGRLDSATAPSLVVSHGNSPADGYKNWEPDQFTRRCRQCHEPHGANWNGVTPNPRNLHMLGKWIDVDGDGQTDGSAMGAEAARVDSNAIDNTVDVDSSDLPVIVKSAGNPSQTFPDARANDSWDDGNNDGLSPPDSLCVVCHVTLVNNHSQVGDSRAQGPGPGSHLPIGTQCRLCHQHGTLENRPNKADDAFGPLSCFACHGVAPADTPPSGQIAGQYWPSGAASKVPAFDYANDDVGAHRNHIDAIGFQLFGELAADLVQNATGTNPTLTAFEKQVEVCTFCHYDPGGSDATPDPIPHFNDTNLDNSPMGRVDVKQANAAGRYFRKFTTGTGPYAGGTNFTDDTTGGAYSFGTEGCTNLVCHNQTATPVAPGGWRNPPVWAAVVNNRCSNIGCHDPATYTNAHGTHVRAVANGGKFYECLECHDDNSANLGHGNGKIDMTWNNGASLEGSIGGDNGYYDKDSSGSASGGDTDFAYKDTVVGYDKSCGLVYCHGGDNAAAPPAGWGGADVTPVWNNSAPDSVYCGSCHDGNGSDAVNPGGTDVAATGNHTDHLNASWGPRFAEPPGSPATSCLGTATVGCHTDFQLATTTHVDGSVEFTNIAATPPSSLLGTQPVLTPTAAETDRCSHCHSTLLVTANVTGPGTITGAGAALAKTNWSDNAYELPCVTCHNPPGTAGTTLPDGSDGPGDQDYAPDMLGDDVNYGAQVRGHNRAAAAGDYPLTGNPAAAQLCDDCHDGTKAHINGSNETSFDPGHRMRISINGQPSVNATQACQACHAIGSSPVQLERNRSINTHSNSGFAARLEPALFTVQCTQCHDPHGMTFNGTGYNIQMISPTIDIAAGVTAAGVRFEALSGAFSFNDGDANDAVDICVVCHMNSNNPGYGMEHDEDGQHSQTLGYSGDERGSNCSTCHTHNQDYRPGLPNTVTVDGLMPLECNACHTFPGKDNLGSPTHRISPSHDQHVGVPTGETAPIPNYGAVFTCPVCHYQSAHNNRGLNVGDAWAGITDGMVQVRFDNRAWPTGWNPGTTLGATRNDDSNEYEDTNNICYTLYCHGDDTARFPVADQGTNTTPDWDNTASANCGTCHDYTAATPPGSLAHPMHAGNAAAQYGIGCQVCHYGTTQNGTTIQSVALHVSRSSEVSFSASADLRVDANSAYNGDTVVGSGYGDCADTYCHSNGADTTAPFTAASLDPAQLLNWDAAGSCWSCHGNGTDDPSPAYADGTPKANKHPLHTGTGDPAVTRDTNGYGCAVCHWPTVHDNASIFTLANHVNRTYNVDDDGAGSTLDQFTYVAGSPGSCDSANCHGGNSGVFWDLASPIGCNICHAESLGNPTAADANDFHWDGSTQSKIDYAAGGEYETRGHGAHSVTCDGCHASSVGHDTSTNLTGANPFRLADNGGTGPGNFTCVDLAAGCHANPPASRARDHSSAQMSASGYTPQVETWGPTPACPDCHDPHGDDNNLHMVQRELVEGSNANWVPTVWPPENAALVFTNDATGADTTGQSFADMDNPYSSICQECHETGDADFTSFKDGTGPISTAPHPMDGVNPGDCSFCHRHRSGFAPTGCEGCHNGDGDGDGVWTGIGYDPDGTGPRPAAPNVMGDGNNIDGEGGTPKPFDDGLWGYNVNGHGANGTAANTPVDTLGAPYLTGNAECTDCHNISIPTGTHLDGTLNSVELKQNRNVNTAHLNATYIGGSSPDWDVQLRFDNQCSYQCHPSAIRHRHSTDAVPVAGAVRFGDKGVNPLNGELIALPIDSALSTNASTNEPDFAPCIACHNPHGTDTVEDTKATNRMLRDNWITPDPMCTAYCHRTYP